MERGEEKERIKEESGGKSKYWVRREVRRIEGDRRERKKTVNVQQAGDADVREREEMT